MKTITKKGVSEEAKALAKEVRDRFVEFVTTKGMSEVSDKTGCNYQALRNSVVVGYNPSLDTLCQVKLGYMEELDIEYLFTGKKSEAQPIPTVAVNHDDTLPDQLRIMKARLSEREEQVKELKNDKAFLQELLKKASL